jgi:mRNA (guanine-N7-)-methyltransferase
MRGRNRGRIFKAEFHAVDCTKQRARDFYKDAEQQFDLVSCQFAFHYCFESLPQAECMLRNISENLRKGGYFIGTTPDSNDIMSRLRASPAGSAFGNSIFRVSFEEASLTQPQPLFGAKYNFHLAEVRWRP